MSTSTTSTSPSTPCSSWRGSLWQLEARPSWWIKRLKTLTGHPNWRNATIAILTCRLSSLPRRSCDWWRITRISVRSFIHTISVVIASASILMSHLASSCLCTRSRISSSTMWRSRRKSARSSSLCSISAIICTMATIHSS